MNLLNLFFLPCIRFPQLPTEVICEQMLDRVNQGLFRDAALAVGHYWFKVKTLEEVEAALQMTPIPLREVSILGR